MILPPPNPGVAPTLPPARLLRAKDALPDLLLQPAEEPLWHGPVWAFFIWLAVCLLALSITLGCSFETPDDALDGLREYAVAQRYPEPGPRPDSFACTLGAVTVWGDDPHETTFQLEGEKPFTVRSEDAVTDVRLGGEIVIVVGDLLVVGDEWVRLGDCE